MAKEEAPVGSITPHHLFHKGDYLQTIAPSLLSTMYMLTLIWVMGPWLGELLLVDFVSFFHA